MGRVRAGHTLVQSAAPSASAPFSVGCGLFSWAAPRPALARFEDCGVLEASEPKPGKRGPHKKRSEEAARELGCDASEERFREVVGKLAKAAPVRNEPSKSKKPKPA